jgi:precorrin-4/cobalt-precorrin-4 C11-methyltransferase
LIHFVGAGPGAPDLITVRGARLLGQADVVVYAGSLVNPELLDLCKDGCALHDSSGMTLAQIVDVMAKADAESRTCVRLHTGDPSLYGAVREQVEALRARGIAFDMVPGVSSFLGAAASLATELTSPEVSQSVILTRAAGRTPVPAAENLAGLASHGCTMVVFLSAGRLQEVQDELLAGGYEQDTPAAIVYKATWPDELVCRCSVSTLAECGAKNHISKTALIVVGEALGDLRAQSKLYDPTFSHGFRASHRGVEGASHDR